jgi:CheY-like chemotaxis protein
VGSQLAGRTILVVEDEPIVAFDIAYLLEYVGAHVVTSPSLRGALPLVEADHWSAAVLDYLLDDGDSTSICERLKERGIPFLLYTGSNLSKGPCRDGVYLSKPAPAALLVRRPCVGLTYFRQCSI